MPNQDRNPQSNEMPNEARVHWVAPKLNLFRAGDAQAGASVGPDGPETGTS